MIRQEIKNLIEKAIKELQKKGIFSDFQIPEVKVESVESGVEKQTYGDYSSAIAIRIRKEAGMSPLNVAEKIKEEVDSWRLKAFLKIEFKKPGFINFFLSSEYLQKNIKEILKQKEKFGELKIGKNEKINVEFISANPTGPLTLGNGRGGFCGDVLANILNKADFKAKREYYINNTGEQIRRLGHSIIGDSEAVYKGDYVDDLKKKIKTAGKSPEKIGEEAARIILEKMIKPAVKKMGIKFDFWFSEKSLSKNKETDKILNYLKKKKLTYEKEGALWFKSTQFGDDKDRVLVKADGEKTYITSDAAYLKNKFDRDFDKLIYIWGADHYGYIARVKAMAQALGFDKEKVEMIIMQLVRLLEKGQEVRMSKRKGIYVTLDELIDEVGLDVARFFFLEKAANTHLDFDLSLAKERSSKNPVYYIQYAHARICSILKKLKIKTEKLKIKTEKLELLTHLSELNLIKQLIKLPEIIEDTVNDYQVQRIPRYAYNLAESFHQFYRDCRVITDDERLQEARLSLISATEIVLKNTLDLMGISAPEKM